MWNAPRVLCIRLSTLSRARDFFCLSLLLYVPCVFPRPEQHLKLRGQKHPGEGRKNVGLCGWGAGWLRSFSASLQPSLLFQSSLPSRQEIGAEERRKMRV